MSIVWTLIGLFDSPYRTMIWCDSVILVESHPPRTPTESLIAQQYGAPLIPLNAVASILGRSPNSLRVLMNQGRGDQALASKLRACRAQLGRRVMFRVADIARLIDEA